MQKKVLLLDVDEVICFANFLESINKFLGTHYVIDDFTDYYIDEAVIPKERFKEFNQFLNNKNLYENAVILPHAIEVIELLSRFYDIFICSSCVNPFDIKGSGRIFADKYNFLLSIFPFIKPEHIYLKHMCKLMIDYRILMKVLIQKYCSLLIITKIFQRKN